MYDTAVWRPDGASGYRGVMAGGKKELLIFFVLEVIWLGILGLERYLQL